MFLVRRFIFPLPGPMRDPVSLTAMIGHREFSPSSFQS